MTTKRQRTSWTRKGTTAKFRRNYGEFAGGSEMGERVEIGWLTVTQPDGRKSTYGVFSRLHLESLVEEFRAGELN